MIKIPPLPTGFLEWQRRGYNRVHGYINLSDHLKIYLDLETFHQHKDCECRK